MICIICETFVRGRRLSMIVISVSFSSLAIARVRITSSMFGEIIIGLFRFSCSMFFSRIGLLNTLLIGTSKKF